MKTLKLWWRWRKAKRSEYPLRYVGPTSTVRGSTIEYGTPLRMQLGPRGGFGGRRFLTADGRLVLLGNSQVEWR